MDVKNLMSGIAIVIDDAFNNVSNDDAQDENFDKIFQIVSFIENQWSIPCYKTEKIPSNDINNNLLKSASFILLDWQLWAEDVGEEFQKDAIKSNIEFLYQVKSHSKPVFIFTNDHVDNVTIHLEEPIYFEDKPQKNFVFIKRKGELLDEINFESITNWIENNASVYVSKSWEQEFYNAKKSLFASMYDKSPDWPKVFWKSYNVDGVDPSSSLAHLINDQLTSRMKLDIFQEEFLKSDPESVNPVEIKSVIQESSFLSNEVLAEDEIKAGDLFEINTRMFYINIRPDCDCVPRDSGNEIDDVELYCIVGKKMNNNKIKHEYSDKYGQFNELPNFHICFSIYENKTVKFKFHEFKIQKFGSIRNKRVGRLIPPHITRLQQRYANFLQRQGIPRIPKEAISADLP